MLDVGTVVVGLNVKVPEWSQSTFDDARKTLQRLEKRRTDFDKSAKQTIAIPAFRQRCEETVGVTRSQDELCFDFPISGSKPRGVDKFIRSFGEKHYTRLEMRVVAADDTSFTAKPVDEDIRMDAVEFRQGEEGRRWERTEEEEEATGGEAEAVEAEAAEAEAVEAAAEGEEGAAEAEEAAAAAEPEATGQCQKHPHCVRGFQHGRGPCKIRPPAIDVEAEGGDEAEGAEAEGAEAEGAFKCRHCGKAYKSEGWCTRHEAACEANAEEPAEPEGEPEAREKEKTPCSKCGRLFAYDGAREKHEASCPGAASSYSTPGKRKAAATEGTVMQRLESELESSEVAQWMDAQFGELVLGDQARIGIESMTGLMDQTRDAAIKKFGAAEVAKVDALRVAKAAVRDAEKQAEAALAAMPKKRR